MKANIQAYSGAIMSSKIVKFNSAGCFSSETVLYRSRRNSMRECQTRRRNSHCTDGVSGIAMNREGCTFEISSSGESSAFLAMVSGNTNRHRRIVHNPNTNHAAQQKLIPTLYQTQTSQLCLLHYLQLP